MKETVDQMQFSLDLLMKAFATKKQLLCNRKCQSTQKKFFFYKTSEATYKNIESPKNNVPLKIIITATMISIATLADVPALNTLINSAYRGETSKKGWTTEANILSGKRTTEDELTQTILDPKNTILKYTQDNTIIGSVLLVAQEHQLYLGMLTVSPELQNSGIGKKMLAEAENHAKAIGLSSIIMTVISVREELIAWYKRHGYVDTGKREAFPESDIHITTSKEPLEFIYLEKKV
nr:GNAT family N-acetyltransferase [uncultured Flavobacterium sp.]